MSGYTTSSEISAKSHGRKSPLSQGQEPPWAFLPLAYRASAAASAMSGQFPPPSASPPIPYTAHHLPPAAPTPGQYPPAPPQRLRVPTLGSSPPPAQGHIPPWGHSAQTAGLNSLPSNLGYFGPPHIGGLGGPGRGQPQPWQTGPKPTSHPVERNPLFSLQMLVSQEASGAGGTVPGIRPNDDYQQETMDLSSHSGSTAIDDHLPSIKKDNLRNGGIVSNGEISNSSEGGKSPAKLPDSVSVIAHNPLRETQESIIGTVLNCSSKSEPKPVDVVMECSSTVKNISESQMVVEKPAVPSLGIPGEMKSDVSSPNTVIEKPVIPSSVPAIEKVVLPSSNVHAEGPVSSSHCIAVEKPVIPSGAGVLVDKPPVTKAVISMVTDDWEGSNHTPDNVESILENMFQTQEEKANSSGALPLVVPQSVIVTNESRGSLLIDSSVSNSTIPVEKPASPEKINEQKLAEILEVEEPDVGTATQTKQDTQVVKEKDEICDEMLVSQEDEKQTLSTDVKENTLKEESCDVKEEVKSSVENVSLESTSSEDVKPIVSESDDKTSQSSEVSSQRSSSEETGVKQLVGTTPDIPASSSAPVETEGIESAKNAFIEVESELEKMFAGIVEPGGQRSGAVKIEMPSVSQQSSSSSGDRKKLTAQEKKRGRPKGTAVRRSSDCVFSIDSSPSKKKQKRLSDVDKKTKKTKVDSGRDSPVVKKGRGSFVKDASNDSGSAVGYKSRGPFIHIEGSRETPSSVIVVNSGVRTSEEDESVEKIAKPPFRKKTTYQEGRVSKIVGSGLYNSTLSSRYDSHTPDATWICVFCKRGPHCDGGLRGEPAGDLFGPYVISQDTGESDTPSRGMPSDRDVREEQKMRGGGKLASLRSTGGTEQFVQKIARKHKRSMSMDSESGLSGLVPVVGEKNEFEVWVHAQCAIWAPGIYLIGSNLVGLQEAVWASSKMACSKCGESGASISCVTHGCPLVLHYRCAAADDWQLDIETFIAKCRNHAKGAGFFPSGTFTRQ